MINTVVERTIKHKFSKNWAELGAQKERRRTQMDFLQLIGQAKEELMQARNNFNYATDALLLEYYIYQIKAAETKLNYYLKKAKDEQLHNPNLAETILFDREGERSAAL